VQAKDLDAIARQLRLASRAKMLAGPAEMRAMLLELIAAPLPASIEIVGTTFGPDGGSAALKLRAASLVDGAPMVGRITVVTRDGNWKVDWSPGQAPDPGRPGRLPA
jgi:hypothetical protein